MSAKIVGTKTRTSHAIRTKYWLIDAKKSAATGKWIAHFMPISGLSNFNGFHEGFATHRDFMNKVEQVASLEPNPVHSTKSIAKDFEQFARSKKQKLKNPAGKIAYIAKYTSSRTSGAGKISFAKKSSALPTIRAIGYPHEIAKSQFERYIGEHVAKIVKDTVKVAENHKGGKRSWKIEVL